MTTYREAAATGFALLAQQYQKSEALFDGNFWFGGNTLHTCLNYLLETKQTDNKKILETGQKFYTRLVNASDWWRDDYAWWGNAFVLAIKNRNELGYGALSYNGLFDDLKSYARDCCYKLIENWSNQGYGGDLDNAAGANAQITGGTFNTHDQPPMSGRNSVTNEGFWLLCQQLAKLNPGNPDYGTYSAKAGKWFNDWFTAYPKNQKIGIFNLNGLVLERPLGNMTAPDWYWSGDQGLMMEALYLNGLQATDIGVAVRANMVDPDGVLHENMSFYAKPTLQQFLADYGTGKGICLRTLAKLNRFNPNHPFAKMIANTATAVWCTRQPGDQFVFNWNPKYSKEPPVITGKSADLNNVIMQTSGLEALAAALSVAPDAEMPPCLKE